MPLDNGINETHEVTMDHHSHLYEKLGDFDGKPGGIMMTSLAQQVLPCIWIGSYAAFESKSFLRKNNIKRILSIGHFQHIYPESDYKHKIIPISDQPETNIIEWFSEAIAFIEESINNKEPILVHCLAGVSRSPTMVIAYIMAKEQLRWKIALVKIKQVRPFIDPNTGFKNQLQLYQNMNYQFDAKNPLYLEYIKQQKLK
ncbi:unnamed protein product [Cunninghamella blakesleeana]